MPPCASCRRRDRRRGHADAAGRASRARACPSSEQIAKHPATEWVKTAVRRYATTDQVMLYAFTCLRYETFGQQPLRVVIIQDPAKPPGYELAVLSTDLDATPAELIERYADR